MTNFDIAHHYRYCTIERKDAASRELEHSVLQIFATKERGERRFPVSAGTATLIQLADRRFLVTAAHVIDAAKSTTIYVGVNGALIAVDGTAFLTAAEKRSDDIFDFAFMEMPAELSKQSSLRFIMKNQMFFGESEPISTVFLALGFPRSKNKKVNIPQRKVKNRRWSFTSRKTSTDLSLIGATPTDHVATIFSKKRFVDDKGKQTDPLSPRGLSGGPLVVLGDCANPSYYATSPSSFRVAGILIEEREDIEAILAVRISTVLLAIARTYPDTLRDLPGSFAATIQS